MVASKAKWVMVSNHMNKYCFTNHLSEQQHSIPEISPCWRAGDQRVAACRAGPAVAAIDLTVPAERGGPARCCGEGGR